MAKVYADLIKKGLKTLDDVPAQLRDDVEALSSPCSVLTSRAIPLSPYADAVFSASRLTSSAGDVLTNTGGLFFAMIISSSFIDRISSLFPSLTI